MFLFIYNIFMVTLLMQQEEVADTELCEIEEEIQQYIPI